jgi:hypothetical protein
MPRKWTKTETRRLFNLLLSNPTADAAELFMQWQEKYPDRDGLDREKKAVLSRAYRLRKFAPRHDRISIRAWSKHLGIGRKRLARAIKQLEADPKIPPRPVSVGGIQGIPASWMKRVIAFSPDLLSDAESLDPARNWFGDEFIDSLCIPAKDLRFKAVRKVDTGDVYLSIEEAAKQNHVDPSVLARAAKKNGRAAGFQWELINETRAS